MPPRLPRPVLAAAALLVLGTGALAGASPLPAPAPAARAAATPLVPPTQDPFYRYDGKVPLKDIAPGTPLQHRPVTLAAQRNETPLPAEQVQYRTTDATGHPVMSVTTFLLPATQTVAPRVVAYLSFYDALGAQCDPSYTLRGGDPGANNTGNADVEQALVHTLRAQGYVVTVPDFENPTLDYVAGTTAGMSSLDGVRATLTYLKLAAATPVALVGYSGGSIAAEWAAELAPRYAPKVNLVGVAAGGMPVNLRRILAYIDGSPAWSSVAPAAMLGIARSYHIDVTPYLSTFGKQVFARISNQCIGDFSGAWPGLRIARLFKPQYADITKVPVFSRIMDKLVMGSAPGRPRAPMLMAAGNMDGTGDGVMIAADQRALAAQYCGQGLPVSFVELQRLEHTQAGGAFFALALPWLAERFTGAPAPETCATLRS